MKVSRAKAKQEYDHRDGPEVIQVMVEQPADEQGGDGPDESGKHEVAGYFAPPFAGAVVARVDMNHQRWYLAGQDAGNQEPTGISPSRVRRGRKKYTDGSAQHEESANPAHRKPAFPYQHEKTGGQQETEAGTPGNQGLCIIGGPEVTDGDKEGRGGIARLYDSEEEVAPQVVFLGILDNLLILTQGVLSHYSASLASPTTIFSGDFVVFVIMFFRSLVCLPSVLPTEGPGGA